MLRALPFHLHPTLPFLLLSIQHKPSFSSPSYLPLLLFSSLLHPTLFSFSSPSYTILPSTLHSTPPFVLFSILHYFSFPLHPTLSFLLHHCSFSSPSYTILPFPLHPTLPFHLLFILNYPSFSSQSYNILPSSHYPTLPFLL